MRDFADYLGCSERTVFTWERTPGRRPYPRHQTVLDMALSQAPVEGRRRFLELVGSRRAEVVIRLLIDEQGAQVALDGASSVDAYRARALLELVYDCLASKGTGEIEQVYDRVDGCVATATEAWPD